MLILEAEELAVIYRNNWLKHLKHAEPF